MKKNSNNRISNNSIALLSLVQSLGFGLLGMMTIVALGLEVFSIIIRGTIGLDDILLLFIYLQVFTMVRTQLVMGEIPLSIPFTIAMLALSRYLIQGIASWQALAVGGSMLLLALSLAILRYWKHIKKFPPKKKENSKSGGSA